MLVTDLRSKVTSSQSVRLTPCTMLPSMHFTKPSGLMICAQSCATVNLRALAGRAIDIDFGNDGDAGAVPLRIGNPAARYLAAALVAARRRSCLPLCFLRGRFDHGDIAGLLDMPQSELDRICIHRGCHFVDERFACEVDLRTDRITQMRAA